MSRRTERMGSLIRQELAGMILRDLNDPRLTGLPSITRVRVSEDLSNADVYVTIMGTPGQQNAGLIALRHSAGLMRHGLTKAMTTRTVPYLKFHLDERLKVELETLDLLRKVAEENAALDRQRAIARGEKVDDPEADDELVDEDAAGDEGTVEESAGDAGVKDQEVRSIDPQSSDQPEDKSSPDQ